MGFSDFAREARKNTLVQKSSPKVEQNDISDAIMDEPKEAPKRQDISYKDSEIKGYVPQQKTFGTRMNSDPRHGSIIRGIASESSSNSQTIGGVSWEECKHRKNSSGRDFCSEYHSLCAKQSCKRARK